MVTTGGLHRSRVRHLQFWSSVASELSTRKFWKTLILFPCYSGFRIFGINPPRITRAACLYNQMLGQNQHPCERSCYSYLFYTTSHFFLNATELKTFVVVVVSCSKMKEKRRKYEMPLVTVIFLFILLGHGDAVLSPSRKKITSFIVITVISNQKKMAWHLLDDRRDIFFASFFSI